MKWKDINRWAFVKMIQTFIYIAMAITTASCAVNPSLFRFIIFAVEFAAVCYIDRQNGWGLWEIDARRERYRFKDYYKGE